jgi:RHS repeat-associated protein
MMRMVFFPLLSLCLLARMLLIGADPRLTHVMSQLEFLPSWCFPSLFFSRDKGMSIEGYRIEKKLDESGRVVQVQLIKEANEAVDEVVSATWESGRTIDRLVRVDGQGISHLFEYDENDCAVTHILKGNLTGRKSSEEEYRTIFSFDSQNRPVEVHEQNGRVRLFKYPDNADPYFVIVEKGVGSAVRYATASDESCFEEIEDDGWNFNINDCSSLNWRRWKKICVEDEGGKICQTTTIGGFDPKLKIDLTLRKEVLVLSDSGEALKTEVFDKDGMLVSHTLSHSEALKEAPMSLEEIRDFVQGISLPSMAGPLEKVFENRREPLSAAYTSRGQTASVLYKDGSSEEYEYSPDGSLCQKVYQDGHRVALQRDCQGRVLESTRWNAGASSASTIRYWYEGPFLCSWKMENGSIGCAFERDCFGRIVRIESSSPGKKVNYVLSYDALDRLTSVEVCGDERWGFVRRYSLDGQNVTTQCTKDGKASTIQDRYSKGGRLLFRKVEEGSGQVCLYSYDDKGRLVRIDQGSGSELHMAVVKEYEMSQAGDLFRVASRFPDGTMQIEERGRSGQVVRRAWIDGTGAPVLEEKTTLLDSHGSIRVDRVGGGETRTVEWHVGNNGHLATIDGVVFQYDSAGRCVSRRSAAGREIRYEWNEQGQISRQYTSDGSIDYRFFYGSHGRITKAEDCISGHTVVRDWDESGNIILDGEKATMVQARYDGSSQLLQIDLPDGGILRYDGRYVCKENSVCHWKAPISVEEGSFYESLIGSVPTEIEFHDPLGGWKEIFRYDVLNQLQSEEGEFRLEPEFDCFGASSFSKGCLKDGDGNIVASPEGDEAFSFDYDGLGRVSKVKRGDIEEQYRYDGFGRVQEIYRKGGWNKKLCWLGMHEIGAVQQGCVVELKVPHPKTFQPIAIEVFGTPFRVEHDARGSIIAVYDLLSDSLYEVYRYSAFGKIHIYGASLDDRKESAVSPWLYYGKRKLECGYDFGPRRYSPLFMRWLECDPLGVADTADGRIFARNNPVAFTDPSGLFSFPINWKGVADTISNGFTSLVENTYKTVTFAKERLDWLLEFRSTYENLFFELLGTAWLRCSGYNLDSSISEVHKGKIEGEKVRITLINGILNGAPEAKKSAALLSSTHGDVSVHFIYAATAGFSGDLIRGAFAKAGFASPQAKMLITLWRQLIEEMGGVHGGGVILHYAHSLGATDTLNALQRLEPEERALIRVCTFGSPTLIDDGVCAQVDNYVSMNDGVPLLDYLRYVDGAQGLKNNIYFLPSSVGIPFVDHYFTGPTYSGVLQMLGQKFQEEFLLGQH